MKFHGLTYRYLHVDYKTFRKDNQETVDQIPCAFFFTKKNIFTEAGKMDARYELFFEDVDLSYQISRNFKLAVDTSVSVTHLGGESFRMSDDYWLYGRFMISMIIFFRKNYGSLRSYSLKYLSILNSVIILSAEKIKSAFGKEDDYRFRKHKHFLNELGKIKI